MEVKATNAKIWRKDYEGKNGEFYRYSVSISKKVEDKWVSAYLPIMFSKKSGAPQKIENGATCNFSGFLSVDSYTDREGKTRTAPMIVAMNVSFDNEPEDMGDSYEQLEEDIPF